MGMTSGCRRSDFYPRPPRGGRPGTVPKPLTSWRISIHALREEGDHQGPQAAHQKADFYPRPPRGGRRKRHQKRRLPHDFYPRPPRGGRPYPLGLTDQQQRFLSTPSARRATNARVNIMYIMIISIHALREEGDSLPSTTPASSKNFYPRPPRGGRPCSSTASITTKKFLSTPSARRATQTNFFAFANFEISIHALREEGDRAAAIPALVILHFYPRPPRGGRLLGAAL